MSGEKWRQHLECVQLIRRHPGWTDDEVAEAAGLRKAEMAIVAEARREAETEEIPRGTSWDRSY